MGRKDIDWERPTRNGVRRLEILGQGSCHVSTNVVGHSSGDNLKDVRRVEWVHLRVHHGVHCKDVS